MFHEPKIIQSATGESKKMVKPIDGIMSGALTSFQKDAIEGVIADTSKGVPKVAKMTSKVKPSKTKKTIGVVGFPGSKM